MIDLILGRRFQGKTTLGYYLVSQMPVRMIFDPRGLIRCEFSTIVVNHGELLSAVKGLLAGTVVEIVMTPEANVNEAFESFCRLAASVVRARPGQPFGLLIDEVRFMDIDNENLDWILRTSSVDATRIYFTGHRPRDIPIDIRAIADRYNLFQFTLRRDLDVIAEQTSDAVAAKVSQLKPRQFVTWNDQIGKMSSFSDPAQWYVKLSDATVPTPIVVREVTPDLVEPERGAGKLWDDD